MCLRCATCTEVLGAHRPPRRACASKYAECKAERKAERSRYRKDLKTRLQMVCESFGPSMCSVHSKEHEQAPSTQQDAKANAACSSGSTHVVEFVLIRHHNVLVFFLGRCHADGSPAAACRCTRLRQCPCCRISRTAGHAGVRVAALRPPDKVRTMN